jgi:glycine dehydrogenase subunit 1
MDVANASIYCGGTALAEASALAVRHTHRNKVLVASAVHPHHLQILRTYGNAFNYEVVAVPTPEGAISIDSINRMIDDKTAAVVVQQPNFYGILEEALDFAEIIHSQGALYIISFDPISLGILKPPGEYGADIAVAEGQSLGNPLNYGGPYLGVMSAREQFVRSIPGRIAGETVDAQGRRGFVLTLQTREQHIRREKATSNICTNQALCALVAAMELCLLGKSGLVEMAEQSLQKAHYLAERITKETNFKLKYPRKSFFKEFLLTSEYRAKKVVDTLAKSAILVGPSLGRFYPVEDEYSFLVAVTESRSKAEMDTLVEELKKF